MLNTNPKGQMSQHRQEHDFSLTEPLFVSQQLLVSTVKSTLISEAQFAYNRDATTEASIRARVLTMSRP